MSINLSFIVDLADYYLNIRHAGHVLHVWLSSVRQLLMHSADV